MNDETWKDIEGYEGKYQVSDLGRVRSLARVSERGRTIEAKFLFTFVDAHGYLAVNLAKTVVSSSSSSKSVHLQQWNQSRGKSHKRNST